MTWMFKIKYKIPQDQKWSIPHLTMLLTRILLSVFSKNSFVTFSKVSYRFLRSTKVKTAMSTHSYTNGGELIKQWNTLIPKSTFWILLNIAGVLSFKILILLYSLPVSLCFISLLFKVCIHVAFLQRYRDIKFFNWFGISCN